MLGLAHVDPTSTTTLTDADGSPTKVFRNVSGHRDFGDSGKGTECPGTVLYNRIETLRPRIKTAQGAMFYAPRVDRTSWTYGTGGAAKISATTSKALAWRLEVRSVCSGAVLTTRTGTSAATSLAATWDGRIGSAAAPPGGYTLTLTATAGSGSTSIATPWQTAVTVGDAPGAPPGYCPPRLGGASRFDVAVAASREADSGTTSVVIANGRDNAMGDALVSAPLARAKDAVLLLTDATGLPTATRTEPDPPRCADGIRRGWRGFRGSGRHRPGSRRSASPRSSGSAGVTATPWRRTSPGPRRPVALPTSSSRAASRTRWRTDS